MLALRRKQTEMTAIRNEGQSGDVVLYDDFEQPSVEESARRRLSGGLPLPLLLQPSQVPLLAGYADLDWTCALVLPEAGAADTFA